MRLTMLAFVIKSPRIVGNHGTCWLFVRCGWKNLLNQVTCARRTQREHRSCETMVGVPGTVPHEHLWEREAPSVAWSELEERSSQDISPLGS